LRLQQATKKLARAKLPAAEAAELAGHLGAAKVASRRRDAMMHSFWVFGSEGGPARLRLARGQVQDPVSVADIDAVAEALGCATTPLEDLYRLSVARRVEAEVKQRGLEP
jgi:hypothetical protein